MQDVDLLPPLSALSPSVLADFMHANHWSSFFWSFFVDGSSKQPWILVLHHVFHWYPGQVQGMREDCPFHRSLERRWSYLSQELLQVQSLQGHSLGKSSLRSAVWLEFPQCDYWTFIHRYFLECLYVFLDVQLLLHGWCSLLQTSLWATLQGDRNLHQKVSCRLSSFVFSDACLSTL